MVNYVLAEYFDGSHVHPLTVEETSLHVIYRYGFLQFDAEKNVWLPVAPKDVYQSGQVERIVHTIPDYAMPPTAKTWIQTFPLEYAVRGFAELYGAYITAVAKPTQYDLKWIGNQPHIFYPEGYVWFPKEITEDQKDIADTVEDWLEKEREAEQELIWEVVKERQIPYELPTVKPISTVTSFPVKFEGKKPDWTPILVAVAVVAVMLGVMFMR